MPVCLEGKVPFSRSRLFFSFGLTDPIFMEQEHIHSLRVVGKWGFWDIDLGNFRKLGQDFLNLNFAEKPKNKRKKSKFFTKNKNKKFIFFKKKLGQEIEIRINPDKTGKIRKSFLGH